MNRSLPPGTYASAIVWDIDHRIVAMRGIVEGIIPSLTKREAILLGATATLQQIHPIAAHTELIAEHASIGPRRRPDYSRTIDGLRELQRLGLLVSTTDVPGRPDISPCVAKKIFWAPTEIGALVASPLTLIMPPPGVAQI